MDTLKFSFQPRWKEELVCSCALGSLILEMPMGKVSVYVPTQGQWPLKAPAWAAPHWETLRAQLVQWCAANRIPLYVDESAMVF